MCVRVCACVYVYVRVLCVFCVREKDRRCFLRVAKCPVTFTCFICFQLRVTIWSLVAQQTFYFKFPKHSGKGIGVQCVYVLLSVSQSVSLCVCVYVCVCVCACLAACPFAPPAVYLFACLSL